MEQLNWREMHISTILGLPNLDPRYLPPHAIVTLKERLSEVADVGAIILFGSVVRGEVSPKSDIDIMIIPMKDSNVEALGEEVATILRSIETSHELKISFSPIIHTGSEDSYFLWEAMKDGCILFARPEMLAAPADLAPYALISYSFAGLNQQVKKKMQRFLFESKHGANINMKDKTEYIGQGVLLVSMERSKEIIAFFESNGVSHTLAKLWK